MAFTNIASLDALDSVVGASVETSMKGFVNTTLKRFAQDEPRLLGLFVGQMSAESADPDFSVASPTVKFTFTKSVGGQWFATGYLYLNSAWVEVLTKHPLLVAPAA